MGYPFRIAAAVAALSACAASAGARAQAVSPPVLSPTMPTGMVAVGGAASAPPPGPIVSTLGGAAAGGPLPQVQASPAPYAAAFPSDAHYPAAPAVPPIQSQAGWPPPIYPPPPAVATPAPGASAPAPDAGSPDDPAFQKMYQDVFQRAVRGNQALPPDMITFFRALLDQNRRAAAGSGLNGLPPALAGARSISLSLKPGEPPPTLHLMPGIATVVTFSDQTGAQWPVNSVTVGDPNSYTVVEAGEKGKSNMVVISPLTPYASANLVVTLATFQVPVIMMVETGRGTVDGRLDVGVMARGPNATYDIAGQTSLAPTNDVSMQAFADGTPPKDARKVKTSSRDVEAWRFQDLLYVRTPLRLLSPAWIGEQTNVSMTNVYSLGDTPVLVLSKEGRTVQVTLER